MHWCYNLLNGYVGILHCFFHRKKWHCWLSQWISNIKEKLFASIPLKCSLWVNTSNNSQIFISSADCHHFGWLCLPWKSFRNFWCLSSISWIWIIGVEKFTEQIKTNNFPYQKKLVFVIQNNFPPPLIGGKMLIKECPEMLFHMQLT